MQWYKVWYFNYACNLEFCHCQRDKFEKKNKYCQNIENKAILYIYIIGTVVQLVRAPPCHGGSCGFESRQSR